MIAQIAIEGIIYAIDKPYSYSVPSEFHPLPGMRVTVPFGHGNRTTEGMVLSLSEAEGTELKPILSVLDPQPVLSERMLRLAAFVRERYFCTFYDAIHAMLPAGLWLVSRETVCLQKLPDHWEKRLESNPLAKTVVSVLQQSGGEMKEETLLRQLAVQRKELQSALDCLREKRLIRRSTDLLRRESDKTEKLLNCEATREQIAELIAKKKRSAPMQSAVMELLGTVGTVSMKELQYFTGASTQTINSLERAGLLSVTRQQIFRRGKIKPASGDVRFVLNSEQEEVFDALCAKMESETPGAALLYGVTGSGKTAIYIHLIRRCLAKGKTALLMVPEIALTPQLLSLFAACFGEQIAVLHSALRLSERYDEYQRIRLGEARVVIGTRSAVFAPLEDLGIIILDEEQEHTYKSESSPRYHAREVALYRGARENALVLMGSATPSVETMYRAKSGIYQLYRLKHRYNGKDLPAVELVDMKQELYRGSSAAVSTPLLKAIRETLDRHEKAILLLNRRGGNRLALCVDCGYVPVCPRCSVNLTYHMANNRLMCHYCGFSQPLFESCPECGGHLKRIGFGTQQLQYELEQAFPDTEILRMDADTVTPTNTHEAILRRFETEDVPILVGTQMVAKGLNFPAVTLVGVVDADMSLYVDNYRAGETTFSLVTQVVGRSGRGTKKGRAILQTYTPKNRILLQAAKQDYDSFYEAEIPLRRLRGCPPFCDLIRIGFVGFPENLVEQCARSFADSFWEELKKSPCAADVTDLLGPAPAAILKVNNKFRFHLTLCCKNTKSLRLLLSEQIKSFFRQKQTKGVNIYVDVNGYE